ncbi:MAG TPA: DEAD/DEAH box helicase family protein [Acidimicrobiales bacterium]|nr:DEAD/DEAH box helicase family protein [Acidimicrobiales bacterium]
MSTPFDFLRAEFPHIHREALQAGANALGDPRTACFYARRVVELSVTWAFDHDPSLAMPYEGNVSALLHEPTFKALAGDKVFRLAKEVVRLGNRAAHDKAPPSQHDSVAAVSHLFQFCFWFARTYNRGEKPPADLTFDPRTLPRPGPSPATTAAQIQELQRALEESELARQRAQEELADRAKLEAELEQLRAEVAQAKRRAAAIPDEHDYSEAETRDYFIDLLLTEAGWTLDQPRDREFEVSGMPGDKKGYVDYVLWGEDGRPLAVIEAKRTRRDAKVGQQQAKLYADCLEQAFGQRPVIFYTNGYEHWIWDDHFYPPRAVQGFYKRDELELLIQRRTTRTSLATTEVDSSIVERYYQNRCIRRIGEAFEVDNDRKALVVMATGAGKTRTVVALSDLLIRANWAKRILFLADRTALVQQATNVFKAFLPDSSPVNLVTERNDEGRVYVSTYPTMMNLINRSHDGQRRFGPGHFDLVVIDEAHRSVFQKYRAIFDYFDSLLVGLTATPREEIDRNTYGLFDLESGVPTDAYGLDEAVADRYLVPPRAVSVPLKFQREGIRYDDRSEEEKDLWDELEWAEEGDPPPDVVGPEAINKWLFNADTVDKVLEHLMTRGQKVAGGDRLGKTILFAKNQNHAEFIARQFNLNYPQYKGEFARVITNKTEYAQDLIDKFSIPDRDPHIAISVDMLDTGIDIPEVVNLVFFKIVRSKTKFWQMLGRGTRLRPDLFGPGEDKAFFYVFDYCQNLEFFNQNPTATDGAVAPSLSTRLFTSRLDLIATLDATKEHHEERRSITELLRTEVAAMNLDNFVVRPHRRLVERFREAAAWEEVDVGELSGLAHTVAGLPTELAPEPEEAKRFDLLMLSLELALLRTEPGFPRLQQQVRQIAGLLEEYPTIPAVAKELALIADVQTDEWWTDVTLPMLETVRRRLRLLIPFIEKHKRKIIYTDFEDEIGTEIDVEFAGLAKADDFERFRKKARTFLVEHRGDAAIEKIHRNRPITAEDIAELQRVLVDSGVGTTDDFDRAQSEAGSFGLFVRRLVGLDRAAAKELFAGFLDDKRYSANQIEFVNLVIDELTENGVIEPRRFYESPFTDLSPQGPDALFETGDVDRLLEVVAEVRRRAEAA